MDIALSLLVLAAIALTGGGYVLFRQGRRKQAVLMLLLAAVMVLNLAIWTVPMEDGQSLTTSAPGR